MRSWPPSKAPVETLGVGEKLGDGDGEGTKTIVG